MLRIALCLALVVSATSIASAHCQVPCGIYGDQLRFEQMLEDGSTIAKAQVSLADLSAKSDPQSVNQAVRWVTTKEDHAQKIQDTIAAYFMAQRIKTDDPAYGTKLMAAHKVMVAAMKAKQSADPATAEALKKAILDFYRAYEGKEPSIG
ncbi:MAG: superoxide dismutase [Ni] [Planctomycetota bacterium]